MIVLRRNTYLLLIIFGFCLESCTIRFAAPVAFHAEFPFICFNKACRKKAFYYEGRKKSKAQQPQPKVKPATKSVPQF